METSEGPYPAGECGSLKGRKNFSPIIAECRVFRVLSARSEYDLPEASGPADCEIVTAAGRDKHGGIPGASVNLSSLNGDASGTAVIETNGCSERRAVGGCEHGRGAITQIASGERHRIVQVSFHGQV